MVDKMWDTTGKKSIQCCFCRKYFQTAYNLDSKDESFLNLISCKKCAIDLRNRLNNYFEEEEIDEEEIDEEEIDEDIENEKNESEET